MYSDGIRSTIVLVTLWLYINNDVVFFYTSKHNWTYQLSIIILKKQLLLPRTVYEWGLYFAPYRVETVCAWLKNTA